MLLEQRIQQQALSEVERAKSMLNGFRFSLYPKLMEEVVNICSILKAAEATIQAGGKQSAVFLPCNIKSRS